MLRFRVLYGVHDIPIIEVVTVGVNEPCNAASRLATVTMDIPCMPWNMNGMTKMSGGIN